MKKFSIILVMMTGLLTGINRIQAQTPDTIPVPMGCFEQWFQYPADSASLGFFSLPINYDYELPEGWSVPMYFINETLSYYGMNLPISANIPLGLCYADTTNAPQGSKAVVAETFMMEDVMNPTAYALAATMLDSTLTAQALPTVVANGNINLERLLELAEMLMGNTSDINWLLGMVDSVDINEFITGGFALNGFSPNQLIGMYKYILPYPTATDHGAVVAIGTRYDTASHRRMLVGAGSKMLYQLYDTINYEPFQMDYVSLSSYFPESYGFYDADSMIVLILSSADTKGFKDGSRIFIDSLQLVSFGSPCGQVENFRVSVNEPFRLQLDWNNTATPDSWELEYGPKGFVRGFGTNRTLSDSTITFATLDMGRVYDFFVRGICGDTAETEWVFLSVKTDTIPSTQDIAEAWSKEISLFPNPTNGISTLDLGALKAQAVKLYDMQGRLVEEIKVDSPKVILQLPQTGIYVAEVITEKGSTHMRVIKK